MYLLFMSVYLKLLENKLKFKYLYIQYKRVDFTYAEYKQLLLLELIK